ncbi:MAG TPA: aldo/keto reductase [Candidatus Binataceae bacterium]|jgi:aryl-alcohol dehydrogenase-like predicted oxidoreductase|nr:aldo/keto reductase [Candidatus Binataceae bacterium]
MERRRLGKTGMEVSVLGFGASEIGYEHAPPATVERLLGGALDAGLNLIDTAACYADSEDLVGRAIGHRRGEVFLMTKCGHAGAEFNLPDWSPSLIVRSIERSLKRLRTDYLDVVQLHSCDSATLRDGSVIAELQRARDRGLTRFIGYSGDSDDAIAAIRLEVFDTLQISINIADQEALERVLPLARERDLGVIAKRPIANAAWLGGRFGGDLYSLPYRRRLRKLAYGFLKSPPQEAVATALRFTLTAPGVHTAIVGTKRPSRWEHNARLAARGPLPDSEYEAIRARWRMVAAPDWTGQR